MQRLLDGIDFPKSRDEIVSHAREHAPDRKAMDLLELLPEQTYRDSAEITRALGSVKSKEKKPSHQPSKLGGEQAVSAPETPSAARVTKALKGVDLPRSAKQLQEYAKAHTDTQTQQVIARLPDRTYHDMADITKALGELP